jgi:putative component of membrane protein insertase Oxa1/YidC/SpoIIIJ protein YidD
MSGSEGGKAGYSWHILLILIEFYQKKAISPEIFMSCKSWHGTCYILSE